MCRVLILGLCACLLAACNLQQGVPTLIPTPDIPRVQFLSPPNNSTVLEGVDLTIEILATDPGPGITKVELLVDEQPHQTGQPQVSAAVPTFTVKMNWLAQGVGKHPLTAIAYRADGRRSDPTTLIVEVLPRPTRAGS
jgi:hypothetical protein